MINITAEQLFLHGVGDYLLQSDWMALNKTSMWVPAFCHAFMYSLPFLMLTQSPLAMAIIGGSHYLIDRYKLAKYVVFARNFLSPKSDHPQWQRCQGNGFDVDRPVWLSTWLFIIADNLLHVLCNSIALQLG
jgi:hypothetical protein